jgi:hypothetical protein
MPRPTIVRLACFVLGLAQAVLLSGCGGSGGLTVEGKVTADDKPLTRGSVAFFPDTAKGNTSEAIPGAEIGANGDYKLFTGGKPGAPAGWYKVTVVSANEVDSDKPEAAKSFVAPRFSDPKETPLVVEVKASAPAGHYDLKASAK